MKEVALAEDHSIRTISVLNLMNQNRNKDINFSMGKSEQLLKDWVEEGYFYMKDGHVFFGVRSVAEFGEFLRNKFNVDNCHLCKAILLKVGGIIIFILPRLRLTNLTLSGSRLYWGYVQRSFSRELHSQVYGEKYEMSQV